MRIAVAIALAAGLGGAAVAADSATYNVSGTGPDGTYKGTVTLTKLDAGGKLEGDAYRVVWSIAGQSISGVGVVQKQNRNQLSIAYTHGGHQGVALMTDTGDAATGVWWLEGLPGSGTESWTEP